MYNYGMSIRGIPVKIKGVLNDDRLFPALVVAVTACAAFGFGRLSVLDHPFPLSLQSVQKSAAQPSTSIEPLLSAKDASKATSSSSGAYVASKKGGSYHLPWCGGASRISEENKVWFATREEAAAAGYAPAANCPGIMKEGGE